MTEHTPVAGARPANREAALVTPRRAGVAVLVLTVLALVLRLLAARQSVVGDELFLYEIVHGHSLGRALTLVHDTESTPPLHFILAWVATRLGGGDLTWIRAPSVLLSTLTVPLVYALGLRTVGRAPGLVAAALFAIVPFDIFYGVEGRAYATVAFFIAASTLALLELVRSGRRRWAVALALTATATMYTHYTAIFVLAVGFAWAIWAHPLRRRLVLAAYAVAALAWVPWIPSYIVQSHDSAANRIKTLYPLNFDSFFDGLGRAWLGSPSTGLWRIPGVVGTLLVLAALVTSAALLVARRARRARGIQGRAAVLPALLAVATPIGALLYELTQSNSIFLPRNMSASVPGALLVTAALITAPRRRLIAGLACLALLAGVAIGTVRALQPAYQRPDYRAVAAYLDRTAAPGDAIFELTVVGGPIGRQLSYYLRRPHPYVAGAPITRAYAQGHRSGHLNIVLTAGAAPLLGWLHVPAQGFRLVARRVFSGFPALELLQYASTR